MAITRKVEVAASADLRGEAIRPHSFQAQFQAAADELASSSGGPAGPSVVERSEGPAPIAASALDRSRSRSGGKLDTPQAAGTGCEPIIGRRRPAVYGYDSMDIEMALRGIENALPFALAAFRCHLENNEHVASFVDFQGFADRVSDLVADELRGPLQMRIDEMRGDR